VESIVVDGWQWTLVGVDRTDWLRIVAERGWITPVGPMKRFLPALMSV
jgi:hypothetical protein